MRRWRSSTSPRRCSARSASLTRRGRTTAGMSRCSPMRAGLSTLPTAASGGRTFTLTLDLCRHAIVLWVSDESREEVPLNAGSVAALHRRLVDDARPARPAVELQWPSERDRGRGPVRRDDRLAANMTAIPPSGCGRRSRRCFRSSRASARASRARPARCISGGAASTSRSRRFSGRPAPPHPGGVPGLPDRITREAYSQEVSSAGFWAGGRRAGRAILLQLCLSRAGRLSRGARSRSGAFDEAYGEFVLPYAEVRAAADPGADARRILAIDLRCRRRPRAMGPRSARARAGRAIEKGAADCSGRPSISLARRALSRLLLQRALRLGDDGAERLRLRASRCRRAPCGRA